MELLGGAGIGAVIGWVAPAVRRPTWPALLATLVMAAIAWLVLVLQIGRETAVIALVAAIAGATVHAVLRDLLSKRAGAHPAPGRNQA